MKLDFKKLFGGQRTAENPEYERKLAVTQLLFEIARADLKIGHNELQIVHTHLRTAYGLGDDEIAALAESAKSRVEHAVSLYDTVKHVNDAMTPEEKRQLVRSLWKVAYADGRLDPYEEALLRRLSELLYVSHQVFIQEKLGAMGT